MLDIDSTSLFRQRTRTSARDGGKRRAQTSDVYRARQFTPCDVRSSNVSKNAVSAYRFEAARNKKPASLRRKKALFREEQG
ncbi:MULTISPECIES: hypothetical protein [unclassified Paraburkholderia]|uniref:hypothetical protein n=1 Tax=unclassified Paraburkholderia TaxID=2615204 RepID=UPI00160B9928|nr:MULTISPECIES: hypothetical protein [unclassified Paraburkholderia]MBB5442912.1 hypothetical protein [Paraburkholderia sp. WSM4177]MBB5483483.1 hypothetical protein [Paraburkholderia sp. WSM4180]